MHTSEAHGWHRCRRRRLAIRRHTDAVRNLRRAHGTGRYLRFSLCWSRATDAEAAGVRIFWALEMVMGERIWGKEVAG